MVIMYSLSWSDTVSFHKYTIGSDVTLSVHEIFVGCTCTCRCTSLNFMLSDFQCVYMGWWYYYSVITLLWFMCVRLQVNVVANTFLLDWSLTDASQPSCAAHHKWDYAVVCTPSLVQCCRYMYWLCCASYNCSVRGIWWQLLPLQVASLSVVHLDRRGWTTSLFCCKRINDTHTAESPVRYSAPPLSWKPSWVLLLLQTLYNRFHCSIERLIEISIFTS